MSEIQRAVASSAAAHRVPHRDRYGCTLVEPSVYPRAHFGMQTTLWAHLELGSGPPRQDPPLPEQLMSLGRASVLSLLAAERREAPPSSGWIHPKWDARWVTPEEQERYEANLARWQTQKEWQEPADGIALEAQATLVKHVAQHRLQSLRVPVRLFPGLQAAAAGGSAGTSRWSVLTEKEEAAYSANLKKWRARAATKAAGHGALSQMEVVEAELERRACVDTSMSRSSKVRLSKAERWSSLRTEERQTREFQEWRAAAEERRPAVLAERGAQIAAAVRLDYPLPDPLPQPYRDDSDDEEWEYFDNPEWKAYATDQLRRDYFNEFVSIAANDPAVQDLHFETYVSWDMTFPDDHGTDLVSPLLVCLADCLVGNTFLRTVHMDLYNHQFAWAAASHVQFQNLVSAVQHSRLTRFDTPHVSFFNQPSMPPPHQPDSDNPGKFSLVAAGSVIAIARAVEHNRNRTFYRSFQRMLLRAVHEWPAGVSADALHRSSRVDLPFSADLFGLVCDQLDCCFVAPLTSLADLPTFVWHVVPETKRSGGAANDIAGDVGDYMVPRKRNAKRARSPEHMC